jgi:uncharacterized membrane protein YphA (DoxX/SURF4 family)
LVIVGLTVLRVALGVLFLISSISKLQHPDLFVDAVQEYDILPGALAEVFGTVLPWAELFIGWCLVLGIFTTFASAVTIAMVVSFIVGNSYSFVHDVGEACGCLGDLVNMSHIVSLIVDIAMLLVAGLLIYQRKRAGIVGIASLARAVAGKRKWLVVTLQLALVVLLTGAVGGGITAAGQEPDLAIPDSADSVLLYFWNGCEECHGAEKSQVESLRPEYGDRLYFLGVDYGLDRQEHPDWVEAYGVDTDWFTVLLLARESEDGELVEQARFVGSLKYETFDLAAIEDGIKTLLDATE